MTVSPWARCGGGALLLPDRLDDYGTQVREALGRPTSGG